MKVLWNKLISTWNGLIAIIDTPLWLEIFFAVLLILRIPSFFEPYYYGDEMIYLSLGEGVRQGVPLYSGLHDNKPPLLYLTAAIAGNLFWFKVILAFWSLITVYGFWKLINHLFPKKESLHKISTLIFGLLTTLPLLEGNTVNAELFMIGPVIFAFWILLSKINNFRNVFISGILFSIAALFKIPAAFDILGIVVFWLIFVERKTFLDFIKKSFYLFIGFIIPIGLTFVWYYFAGSFKEYLIAAFLQNFGYVSSWQRSGVQASFLVKNGPLLIRAGIMFAGFVILWVSRNKLSKNFIFISAWLLATLFAVTLSERPYPHYLVQSVGPISILIGILVTNKTLEQSLTVIPLTLAFFVPFYYKFWYYPTSTYYSRFINFAIGKIDKQEYLNSFSPYVSENYNISNFLSKSLAKNQKVFIWGNDSATIYSLAKRLPPIKYVADYHIYDFSNPKEIITQLEKSSPKFIIVSQNSKKFDELSNLLQNRYFLIENSGSSQIWIKLENEDN